VIRPRLEDLARLAPGGGLVPVFAELPADLETPVSAYLKLAGDGLGFLLESVEGGERLARYSFLGANPRAVVRIADGLAEVSSPDGAVYAQRCADPLDVVRGLVLRPVVGAPADLPRFTGGAVGYLAYECSRYWERLPLAANDPGRGPDAVFLITDTLVVFDHLRHRLYLVTHIDAALDLHAEYARAVERIERVAEALRRPLSPEQYARMTVASAAGASRTNGEVHSNLTPEQYLDMVRAAKQYIVDGEIIQVVLSQRLSRQTSAPPFSIYRALRSINPSPYMYYLSLGDQQIVGASPEMLVRAERGTVATHPIAGTRRRGATPEDDARLEADLRSDIKERAEHLMLLDLGRNDIGRVAEPGSVQVRQFMEVERYSHVMHLVSHVTGRLRGDHSSFDALRACFPAGTVSGAPKIRAMEIIAELEPDQRGVYAGAIGYVDHTGTIDTAIAIRTMVIRDGVASIQAGGGIVADSVPEEEYQESMNKARAVLVAASAAEGESDDPARR